MNIGLGASTQTVPESNATNANIIRTNNTQSLSGDVIQLTMSFLIALFFGCSTVFRSGTKISIRCDYRDKFIVE